MTALARPWRRWAVAAPAGSFVIAVFVLAPGGIPAIGMPAAVEVGAGTRAGPTATPGRTDPVAPVALPSTAHPSAAGAGQGGGAPSRPGTRPAAGTSTPTGVTVVSAQQPVVVTTGGEPGDDGGHPSPSGSAASPSPSASSGGDGPGDQ